jgi:hypothetical protein
MKGGAFSIVLMVFILKLADKGHETKNIVTFSKINSI